MTAILAALPLLTATWWIPGASPPAVTAHTQSQTTIRIRRFLADVPLPRAGKPVTLRAYVENVGKAAARIDVRLSVPRGVRVTQQPARAAALTAAGDELELKWVIVAQEPLDGDLGVEARGDEGPPVKTGFKITFLPPLKARKLPYIPDPEPVKTDFLIGAHNCPLWEADHPEMWANVLKHPERTPALGFYAQENPEVADWETKWAVEHGVSFFIYCWYRTSQGGPVKQQFGSAIHDALLKSRFRDRMKFTIMWENQSRGKAGVTDEQDLMTNLLPFWMENYFKNPGYLKVDNKPVLFIYRPEFLVDDLGGVEKVRQAFDKMRRACREAGFDGLYLLGEYRGLDPNQLKLMKQLGLDYTFAYCWYVPNNPTPEQSIATQMSYIRKTQELGILPQVVTVSQAWSGWADEGTIWKIPPREYETLLRDAKQFASTLPKTELGSRMLLLDNWNEWGEGHYIAPYREYGFGYLDAVRRVFSRAPKPHTDLLPEDIGVGQYDSAFRSRLADEERLRKVARQKANKPGDQEDGLIAWWAFDEPAGAAVALDYSGNRLGGEVRKARRVKGIDGNALVCDGGCTVVADAPALSPSAGISVECWVKTDVAGQANTWMVNRVYSGATDAGYRLGVVDGKPCFEVPFTSFSHHLSADIPLPTGRWVHIAGTFDGSIERIYMDGEIHGSLVRPGPVKPSSMKITLGNYDEAHAAYFHGLLDEVKLYGRALTADEVKAHYRRLAARAGK